MIRVLASLALLAVPAAGLALPATARLMVDLPEDPPVGEEFTADVYVDTAGVAVGGVGVYVKHSDSLEFIRGNDDGSVFDQEVLPAQAHGNTVGFVRLRFDTGYAGDNGELISLTYKRLSDDAVWITVDEDKTEIIAFEDSSNILLRSSEPEVAGTDDINNKTGVSLWQRFVNFVKSLWPF